MIQTISPIIYSPATKLKAFLIAAFGTIVEYYDYALYGFCASYIAQAFFPTDDPAVSLIKTFGAYAIGSLAKPLGSLLFGWIGDKYGRKYALRWSMLGIALPTFILSLTPGYEAWGWMAPATLILCRFAQGFFISGEYDGVRVFIFETMGRERTYLVNGLVGLAAFIGIFLSSFAASILAPIHWRLPFWLGAGAGLLVLLSRRSLIESEDYLQTKPKLESPLCWQYFKSFVATIILCGCVGGSYQILFVYLSSHLSSALHLLTPQEASWLTTQLLSCYLPSLLLGAMLADYFNGEIILRSAISIVFILCLSILIGEFSVTKLYPLAMALGIMHAPGYVLLLKQFPIAVRYRCVSLGHALGSMICSGTAPLVCTTIWYQTEFSLAPILYMAALTFLSSTSLILMKNKPYGEFITNKI